MGRRSKRRRQNISVSSPHANMSNTPPPSMSNLTYAVQNANETLWATTCNPSYVYKCVSNKLKHANTTRTTNTFRSLSLILSNKFNLVNLDCISFSIVCKLNTISWFVVVVCVFMCPWPCPFTSMCGAFDCAKVLCVFNLQTILNDIQSKLTKLNLLDSINDRLRTLNNDLRWLKMTLVNWKGRSRHRTWKVSWNKCRDFHARIQNFEIARDELDHRTKEIHETLLDQQTRSMKYNLIFENIQEVPMYIVKLYIFNLQFAL
jgi:hypothetical protein